MLDTSIDGEVGDSADLSSFEFTLPINGLPEDLLAQLTDAISPIITKETPGEWLNKAGDTLTYELIVRLTHDTK